MKFKSTTCLYDALRAAGWTHQEACDVVWEKQREGVDVLAAGYDAKMKRFKKAATTARFVGGGRVSPK